MNLFKSLLLINLLSLQIYAENLKPILKNGNIANNYAIQIHYDDDKLRLKIITTFEPLESNENSNYIVVEVDEEEHKKLLDLDLNITIDEDYTERINRTPNTNISPTISSRSVATNNTYPGIPNFLAIVQLKEHFLQLKIS